MVNDSHGEEQGAFEKCVGDQHGKCRDGHTSGTKRRHRCEESELGHGPICKYEFEVELSKRLPRPNQHGSNTYCDEHRHPSWHGVEAGREPQNEEDSGFHHGSGVKVRTDRGGCGHGTWKPEVEGNKRRLRNRANEDQVHGNSDDHVALEITARRDV